MVLTRARTQPVSLDASLVLLARKVKRDKLSADGPLQCQELVAARTDRTLLARLRWIVRETAATVAVLPLDAIRGLGAGLGV